MNYKNYKNYYDAQGVKPADDLFDRYSSTTIHPLPELHGRIWDEVALAYVAALRPSYIRVCQEATCDAITDRVTVWLYNDNETIRKIDMEVRIPLPDGFENGHDLRVFMETGEHATGAGTYYYAPHIPEELQ